MGIRDYSISKDAIAQGRSVGLYGDTAKRLLRMAKRSAPFTSEHGNRRFNDYVMKIENGAVTGVTRIFSETAED